MNKKENKSRKREILTIITLILGTLVVALGYASFSSSLAISSSATVNPDNSLFSVLFSTNNSSVVVGPVNPTLNVNTPLFTATSGTINNLTNPSVENLNVTFTEPGQSVTYRVYAHNTGHYLAYLNGITFLGNKTCTPKTGSSAELVANACKGIKMNVKVGNEAATETTVSNISNHVLDKGDSDLIIITITYENGSSLADGNFDVTLPSISLDYDSVD